MLLGGQNATTRQKMNGILEFEEQLARVPCGHVTLWLATCHHFSFSSFPQFMFLILKSLDSLVNYCHNAILCRRIHDSPFHCLLFFFFSFSEYTLQDVPLRTWAWHNHNTRPTKPRSYGKASLNSLLVGTILPQILKSFDILGRRNICKGNYLLCVPSKTFIIKMLSFLGI